MSDSFLFLPVVLLNKHMITEVRKCNDYTNQFGLQLSEEEIGALVEHRKEALQKTGRIEFGGGIIRKLIMEFADSPYINQDNYLETLTELQELFYHYKNESMEELTDDELIKVMKHYFDDICQGSLEYLSSTALENYCRDIRCGKNDYRNFTGYEDNYIDFLDWDEEE